MYDLGTTPVEISYFDTHLLNIIGGKNAKKNTFGENPRKVASKWSSSYAEMS